MKVKKCKKCGKCLPEELIFCNKCGEKLSEPTEMLGEWTYELVRVGVDICVCGYDFNNHDDFCPMCGCSREEALKDDNEEQNES